MDMAWADKQLPPGVTRQDVCIWTQDSDGPWCGSCGVMWEFIDGGPKDNETHFCPRCGGVLLAEPFAEDETPNAIAHRPVEAEGRNGSGEATGSAAQRRD